MRYDAILKSKKNLFKVTVSPIDEIYQRPHCADFHTNQGHLQNIETMQHGTSTLQHTLSRKQLQSAWSGSAGRVLQILANMKQVGRRMHRSTGITTIWPTSCLKQSKANFVNDWNLNDKVHVRSCCWTLRLDVSKVIVNTQINLLYYHLHSEEICAGVLTEIHSLSIGN